LRNGVAFAALAPVQEPTSLDPALAAALGLPLDRDSRHPVRAQLLDYLRAKELLLVLDNCEHLRDAIGTLASAILVEAPGVTLLATSRERLGLRAEQVLSLDGMLPTADGAVLFAATAQAVQPAFVLDDTTRPQVAAICVGIGGMPLAIELAAGWTDTLSLAEIARELAQNDALLVTQASDLPVRHHSVRAVWDATWARLSLEEQTIFAQVGVLRGGGARPAVQAVTGASLGQLHALVGKALLRYDPARERYTVHELLRQYAVERLAMDATAEHGTRKRHATYYLRALAARELVLKSGGQLQALDEIGKDIENVHAAWRWATEAGALDLLAAAVGGLSLADEWLGRSDEGWDAFQRAVAAVPSAPAALREMLLAAQARFALLRGDVSGAQVLLTQARVGLDAYDSAGAAPAAAQAQVLLQVGRCMGNLDLGVAHNAFTRSQELFDALGDHWGAATALGGLGWSTVTLGSSYEEAWGYLEQSVARYRVLGDQIGLSEALTRLSLTTRYLSRIAESLMLGREAYALAQTIGNPRLLAQAGSNLGSALYWSNENPEAYAILRSTLTIILELGLQGEEAQLIYYRLGVTTANLGRYAEARTIYANRLAVAQRVGDTREINYLLAGLSGVALAQGYAQEALRLAEETLAYSTRLGEGYNRNLALLYGSLAARRLGDVAQAWAFVVSGLRFALTTHTRTFGLLAVVLLLADRGTLERAASVFALAERMHLFDNDLTQEIALREIRAVLASLPPEAAAAAQARWAQHDYWAALHDLLVELDEMGWQRETRPAA
jgi:predicted ATPase